MDDLDFFISTIFPCSKQDVILIVCREILLAGGNSRSISCCLLLLVVGFLKTGFELSLSCLLLVLQGVCEVGVDDTAVDGDLGTEGGVGDSEVVGGDTWGMKGIKFDTLGGGDAVRFESEKVKDTFGQGLMYVAMATDPNVLGSGLFCRQ